MNSFKNVRELLLLSYVNNVVSETEFVLLYDAYQSKNPDLKYQQHDPFNLDNIDWAEYKAEFRIERADLPTSLSTIFLSINTSGSSVHSIGALHQV